MFLGNLVSDIFGGIFVGLISDEAQYVIAFSLLWVIVNIISLFTFQRSEFNNFNDLVKAQEKKFGYKSSWNPKIIWFIIRTTLSLILSILIGYLVIFIKKLFF